MKLKYYFPTSLSHIPYRIIAYIAVIAFIIAVLATGAQAYPWWDSAWQYRADNPLSNSTRPVQIPVYILPGVGTNNGTHVFCNNACNQNLSDLRFLLDNTTVLAYYIENLSTGKTWVNITGNGTVNIYYGNPDAQSTSNGNTVFPFFDDFKTNLSKWTTTGTVSIVGEEVKITASSSWNANGITGKTPLVKPVTLYWQTRLTEQDHTNAIEGYVPIGALNINQGLYVLRDETGAGETRRTLNGASSGALGNWNANINYSNKLVLNANDTFALYINDVFLNSGTTTANNWTFGAQVGYFSGESGYYDNFFAVSSGLPEQTWATWGAQKGIISNFSNSYTNNNSKLFTIPQTTTITFNVSGADILIDSYSWYLNSVLLSNTSDNLTQLISSTGMNNITVLVTNTSNSMDSALSWYITLPFTLISPANNSNLNKSFPPLPSDVVFSWASVGYPYYELVVSKDIYFTLIVKDIYTSSTSSTQPLEAGSFYWKVRSYNNISHVYGDWSGVFAFNITDINTATGVGIQGIVYELVNGIQTPIDQATVYVSNADSSFTQTTGANGYFLFQGLTNNSVYYMKAAKKDYQTTELETVNVSGMTTHNLFMKLAEPTYFESDKQYVEFKVRWLFCVFSCDVSGATITLYKYGDVIASHSGLTDATGSIKFYLTKTQHYRVTVTNATAGINVETDIYPSDTKYSILIGTTDQPYNDFPIPVKDVVKVSVTKNDTNGTITVNYADSRTQTTAATYYINHTNGSTDVVVDSWTWSSGNLNHTFTLPVGFVGQSYLIHIKATHTTYGVIDRTFSVFFEKTGVGVPGLTNKFWLWIAIIFMVFTAAIFPSSLVEEGALLLCIEGLIFLRVGAFASINQTQFGIGLALATVIAFFALFKKHQREEGYQ